MRTLFLIIFWMGICIGLTACEPEDANRQDQAIKDIIKNLQQQFAELSENSNNKEALKALEKRIASLSTSGGNSQAALAELKNQLLELSENNNQALLEEMRRQIDELSQKTLDGSVAVSCLCKHPAFSLSTYVRLEGYGANKVSAMKKAEEVCHKYSTDRELEAFFITDCEVKN